MNIKILNSMIYEKYKLVKTCHFSSPLLVSPNQEEKNPKVMYIGQETNTWGNGEDDKTSLEDKYEKFLINGATGKDYWKFIKEILNINKEDIYDNILWANALIASKKDSIGKPHGHEVLFDLSVEYLVGLYNIFKPSKVVIVSGPSDPYYKIITKFLEEIGHGANRYPTISNPLIKVDNNIYWTYHPNYLNKKKLKGKVLTKIRETY